MVDFLQYRTIRDIDKERIRQHHLKIDGKFLFMAGEQGADNLQILVEEVGEVARAQNDLSDPLKLYKELIQVATCAIAWAQSIYNEVESYKEDIIEI